MKTIDDIKVIVFPVEEKGNAFVKKFLAYKDIRQLSFDNEVQLNSIIDVLKKEHIPSKEVIILKRFKGRIFQKCPGSPHMICCNYLLLNTCFNCLYNCTYCFLRSYLNSYGITQFINVETIVDELDSLKDLDPATIYRIGTGEFTDSLMMDEVTGISEMVMKAVRGHPNILIEIKTKSDNISHLLNKKDKDQTVLAWSLNTERNIGLYEPGTAALPERLDAAVRAAHSGYRVSFHFDPIIRYDNFLDDYNKIIDTIFSKIENKKIAWISLGCFRYSGDFRTILYENESGRRLLAEEMFSGSDGKYRYLKKHRIKIYKNFHEKIRQYSDVPYIYLCMETADLWDSVFGKNFINSSDLELDFSNHMNKFMK